MRIGWAAPQLVNPSFLVPNFATKGKGGKTIVGSDVSQLRDFTNLVMKRPHDRGYLLDWSLERQVFALADRYKTFGRSLDEASTHILMTEPLFNPETLRRNLYEEIFETNNFGSLLTQTPPFLSLLDYITNHPVPTSGPAIRLPNPAVGAIVVDSGYSFTHIVPFFDQTKLTYAVKRINVGGKLLTNYLKEIVSYRHWNMMHETYLMNIVKERMCYVPLNFATDLNLSQLRGAANTVRRHYVLPDFVTSSLGYCRETDARPAGASSSGVEEQVLVMNNERLIPEILFSPSDIGIREAGIAETIVQAVEETPENLHELLYSCVIVSGGNAAIPGFVDRLRLELRQLVPSHYAVNVISPKEYFSATSCCILSKQSSRFSPILSAWRGGAKAAMSDYFADCALSNAEYKEKGYLHAVRKFSSL